MKGLAKKAAIAFIAVIAGFAMLEVSARLWIPAPTFKTPMVSSMRDIEIQLDREIGYRFKPYSRSDINNFGFYDDDFPPRKTRKRVLFLGDSFVMGLNVAPSRTLPSALDRVLGYDYRVCNLGVHGYGPDQSLLLMREMEFLEPDVILLGLLPGNDYNDIAKNRLLTLDGKGHLVRNKANPVARKLPSLRTHYLLEHYMIKRSPRYYMERYARLFMRLFRDTYDYDLADDPYSDDSREKISLFREVLREFVADSESKGIPLWAVIIPYPNGLDPPGGPEVQAPDRELFVLEDMTERLCEEVGMRCINLHKEFDQRLIADELEALYDRQDGHFSVYGNLVASEIIADQVFPLAIGSP